MSTAPYAAGRAHGAATGHLPPLWTKPDGTIDTDKYLYFYDQYLEKATVGKRGRLCPRPIQAGADPSCPGRFFPSCEVLRRRKLLLMATRCSQLGSYRQMAVHGTLGVVPDIVTIGKASVWLSVTCVAVREPLPGKLRVNLRSSS